MTKLTTNHPSGSPCWVDIGVPDLRQAIDFYTALFGWEINEGPAETGGYSMCLVDGSPVAALSPNRDPDIATYWWNVYFATDDPDATVKLIGDNGGTVVMPPMDIMGQGRMALAKDPSGAQFGLWQGQAHTGAHIVGEPDSLCWTELTTPDSAASRAFYATVLERPVEDMGVPGFDYATIKVGEDGAAGIWGVPGEAARWTVYFAVDDADGAVARATAAGGSVVREAQDSPYGRFAIVADPFGAALAVMRLPEAP
ncbi:VOC family protein [Actinomadura sp. DC4]|uniref:VOC family protein n=1 Tax=Actinomadura sp. DC4 TaxID=3055069 RepID=UPI0025AF4059|nr:VOC family protein [Actinomadura sp. DC4]MDN3355355.1 VOC family protein [Actinomadura sp. DC4]